MDQRFHFNLDSIHNAGPCPLSESCDGFRPMEGKGELSILESRSLPEKRPWRENRFWVSFFQ